MENANTELIISDELTRTLAAINGTLELMEVVESAEQYQEAAQRRGTAKRLMKALDAKRKELTRPLDEQKKEIMAQCEPWNQRLLEVDTHHAKLMIAFDAEQRRRKEEEQRKLNEHLARKAAEEKAALEAKALAAVKAGSESVAIALIEKAEEVKPVEMVLKEDKPAADGVYYIDEWHFEIVDKTKVPEMYKIIDEKLIRKQLLALKGDMCIEGVRTWSTKEMRQRVKT